MSAMSTLLRFKAIGCEDSIECGIASEVFYDLTDAVKLSKVEPHYDPDLKRLYFIGTVVNDDLSETNNIYLPCHNRLDFSQLANIQNKLCADGKSVVLCIVSSSTVVYYRLTQDFKQS